MNPLLLRIDSEPDGLVPSGRELSAFVERMSELCGTDFRRYQGPGLLRRVRRRIASEGVADIHELLARLDGDPGCVERVRADMTLHVTTMFRDPDFFAEVRRVLSALATYPSPRLWVAGCATGPEVYSYLVLLKEAGLHQRCRVYATDLSPRVVNRARSGKIDPGLLPEYEAGYRRSGGKGHLLDHIEQRDGAAWFDRGLLEGVVFGVHNLLTDASFNEFHFVSCRNVTMYFDSIGQRHAHTLIHESLRPLGWLGLGIGESPLHSPFQPDYRQVASGQPLYQRIR